MIAPRGPEHRVIVLAMIVWTCAGSAGSAQDPDQRSPTTSSLGAVKARVALGDAVYVTDIYQGISTPASATENPTGTRTRDILNSARFAD
jgi:hypothetical protein